MLVALDEATAEARGRLDAVEQEAQRRLEQEEPSFAEEVFWDIVTFGLHGGSLNAGEDVQLWADRRVQQIHRDVCDQVITAVEEAEQVCLGEDAQAQIRELVTVGLGFPELMNELAGEE